MEITVSPAWLSAACYMDVILEVTAGFDLVEYLLFQAIQLFTRHCPGCSSLGHQTCPRETKIENACRHLLSRLGDSIRVDNVRDDGFEACCLHLPREGVPSVPEPGPQSCTELVSYAPRLLDGTSRAVLQVLGVNEITFFPLQKAAWFEQLHEIPDRRLPFLGQHRRDEHADVNQVLLAMHSGREGLLHVAHRQKYIGRQCAGRRVKGRRDIETLQHSIGIRGLEA